MSFGQTNSSLRSHGGSILIGAIWALTIFSILSVAVYKMTSSCLKVAGVLEKRTACYHAAYAAALHAQWKIKKDETYYDSLRELQVTHTQTLGKAAFTYTMQDEESKININTASQKTLSLLPGLDRDLAIAITNSPLRPFTTKEELLLVEEVTDDNFEECKDFITVYGKGAVNINTSPQEVLSALGIEGILLDSILRYRSGPDNREDTADDWVFDTAPGIIETLRSFTNLSPKQELTLTQLTSQHLLDVKSDSFLLIIQTELLNNPGITYEVIVEDTIKQWKER